MGVHTFPNGSNKKMNFMARQAFELACYDITSQHVTHYTTMTLRAICENNSLCLYEETVKDTAELAQTF